MNHARRGSFGLGSRRRRPRRVAVGRRKFGPRAGLPSSPQDDPQRHEGHADDHRFLEPDARRIRQEDWQCEPDDVEREVQDDAGEQTQIDVEQSEPDRRNDELDRARKRWLRRIRRVSRAEDDRLDDEGDREKQPALSEAVADERGAGERNRAEQALFPEAGLERVGDCREPWHIGRQHVWMEQRFGRCPPAEDARGDEVESDVVREEHRDEQIAGGGLTQNGGRASRSLRPHAPELRVMAERAARQRFGRHERQRHERREPHQRGGERCNLPGDERRARDRRVVGHPHQRPLVEGRQCLQRADDAAPDRRLPPQHVAAAQHEEEADADAADHIEEHHADERADADGFVGRPHAVVAACERLWNLHEVGDFGEPIARDHEPEAIAAVAEDRRRSLVGQRVIDAAAGTPLLSLLDEGEGRQVDAPSRARVRFRAAPGLAGVEGGARRVFLQRLDESVRMAVRREPDERLVRFTFSEVAHAPGVGGVEPLAQHARELGLASALQLDEGLRLAVECERGRLPEVRGAQPVPRDDRARVGERALARHRDVERDDRERLREIVNGRCRGGEGNQPKQDPEGRAFHRVLLFGRTSFVSGDSTWIRGKGSVPSRFSATGQRPHHDATMTTMADALFGLAHREHRAIVVIVTRPFGACDIETEACSRPAQRTNE